MTDSLKQYVAETSTKIEPLEDTYRATWGMIDALLGGTGTMRDAGEALLPRWPNEDVNAYAARLASSTLYNVFKKTVNELAAKPFTASPNISGMTDKEVVGWLDDVDLEGRNLAQFGKDWMRVGVAKGLCHVLVDFPRVEPGATLADERAANTRPYLVLLSPERLLGWESARINGSNRLTRVLLSFWRWAAIEGTAPGEHKLERIDQRLEIHRVDGADCLWVLYEMARDKSSWVAVADGVYSVGEIPLVTFYAERVDFMCARPPLLDLAYLNVKHWQSQSDQDNILHVARVPILFGAGFEDGTTITVGSNSAVRSSDANAKLSFVEHSGKAVESGRVSLQDLEARMSAIGAQLLLKRQTGDKSATEAALEGASASCELAAMVESLEDAINLALDFMAEYVNRPSPGTIVLFKDFAVESLGAADMDVLLRMNSIGAVSNELLFAEAQRRKLITDDADFGRDQEIAEEESAARIEQAAAIVAAQAQEVPNN